MLDSIGFANGAVITAIIVIAIVGNSLTLFVIYRYRPLRDVTGMFMANLAFADLLQSIFGMPLIATSSFTNKWIFGETLCVISGVTNSLFCITSVLTLTAISVDRCLAIKYPLHYQTLLTPKRARLSLGYIWAHALFVACLPVFGWSRYAYLPYEFICTVQWESDLAFTIFATVTSFATPVIITIVCYSNIMRLARHHARETPPTTVGTLEPVNDQLTSSHSKEHGHCAIMDNAICSYQKTCAVMLPSNPKSLSGETRRFFKLRLSNSVVPAHSPNDKLELRIRGETSCCVPNFECQFRHPKANQGTSRLKCDAWTNHFHLPVIPEVDETQEAFAGSANREKRVTHLGRVQEWMADRLSNKEKTDSQKQRKKEMKVVLTLLVVNGTFILCWLPHFVGMFCLTLTHGLCPFPDPYHVVTTTLAMLNSGCNPFIYTLTHRKFKKALLSVLPCLLPCFSKLGLVSSSVECK